MSSLPLIHTFNSQKHSKGISFEPVLQGKGRRPVLGESRKHTPDLSTRGNIHGNTTAKDKTTRSFTEMTGNLGKHGPPNLTKTQKGLSSGRDMHNEKDDLVVHSHIVKGFHQNILPNQETDIKIKRSNDVDVQLSKMLREKDREIDKLREIIRKASLDRENATCADATSRLRVAELKSKLSNQQRHVEHVTTVERLRCKEKVNNETERLRHERDEGRVQLAHYEKLVWQLRKQVEQLGYLSRQRYKTIQELNKKMSAKDKSIQEMRKRMEQAQLIAIPGTSVMERRNSISSSETKNISWETPSRLATVNE